MLPDDEFFFAMYFAGLASIAMHPGAGTQAHTRMSIYDCALLADEMLLLHRARYPSIVSFSEH